VTKLFTAGVEAFCNEKHTEQAILGRFVSEWYLDPNAAAASLAEELSCAETAFMSTTGLDKAAMRRLRMHEQLVWRIDECLMRIRGRAAGQMLIRKPGASDIKECVWRLGQWRGKSPQDGKSTRTPQKQFALWTDGNRWSLHHEKWDPNAEGGGAWVVILHDEGSVHDSQGKLPLPMLTKSPSNSPSAFAQ